MAKKKKSKKLTKKQKQFIKKNYKIILALVLILIVVALIIGIVFKDQILEILKGPEPTTPSVSNIKITDDGRLSWNNTREGAEYTIIINGVKHTTKTSYYDFKEHQSEIGDGLLVEIYVNLPDHKKSNKKTITIKFDPDTSIYSIKYEYTYEGYYLGLDYGMSNLEIFNKLHEKINIVTAGNGSQNSSYGEAREILVKSDVEPGKETLFGIYDNAEIPADWGSGNVFQREHVWPNSKLGIERVSNSSRDQGSDPHNLRAIVGSTNASRSNRYYAAGSGVKGYTIGTDEYYPGDNHRGDVARILLYMAVRYKDILTLVETPVDKAYVPEGAQMGKLSLLLEWHEADPVDEFEFNRNEVIYSYQGNRNPFIDHPELFERVYEYIVSTSLKTPQPQKTLQNIVANLNVQKQTYINIKERYFL